MKQNIGLIVIVGQTASGKSALAMEIAEKFEGEVICADSRTIYRGMDIGTAKPSAEDRRRINHHLLDVINPDERFSASQFKELANEAIKDIKKRGKMPIMVGGSGLYIDSVIFDYDFIDSVDDSLRQKLEALTIEELQQEILVRRLSLPENERNKRYLIRSIERQGKVGGRKPIQSDTLLIGLDIDKATLHARIEQRIEVMVAAGFVDECRDLLKQYGDDAPGLLAPGYKAFGRYLKGEISLDQAIQEFASNDKKLAKRQKTWFKRNNSIHWFDNRGEAVDYVTTFLNK